MAASRRPLRRLVVGTALVAGAAVVGRGVARRRPAVREVPDELRSVVLYLPLHVADERVLRVARSMITRPTRIRPGVEVTSRELPAPAGGHGPRVVCYERPGREAPSGALLWIHGGGMIMGWPEQANDWCSRLADELGILVVSVDYRLAPEHPFPAGLTDCVTALGWLHDHADELGVDPARIAVGGDSAGGGLAAALCQRTRDEGGPPVRFQLLNYPMLDDRTTLHTEHGGRGEFVWTLPSNRFGWRAYLGREPAHDHGPAHAAPARTDDLSGLPPAWIGVGDLDLFYVEDVDYAERLLAAGVACELHVEAGMYHGADQVVPGSPRMRAYRQRMVDALADALA